MWKMLGGQVAEFVYVENLRTIVQVISRIIDPKRVIADEKAPLVHPDGQRADGNLSLQIDDSNIADVGFYSQPHELYCVRKSEVSKIQKHFHLYYLNRL